MVTARVTESVSPALQTVGQVNGLLHISVYMFSLCFSCEVFAILTFRCFTGITDGRAVAASHTAVKLITEELLPGDRTTQVLCAALYALCMLYCV